MKILIVYELIPENTEFFLVDSDDQVILNVIKKCHGHYLNYECPENIQEALEILNLMLGERTDTDLEEANRMGIHQHLVGVLHGSKIEGKQAPLEFDGPITVVHTGFAL